MEDQFQGPTANDDCQTADSLPLESGKGNKGGWGWGKE